MAMTKKEQADMKAAIEDARILAALRWSAPVRRDIDIPESGQSDGWDFNSHAMRVWRGWSTVSTHGEFYDGQPKHGIQQGRRMFSTKELALRAMRHELEMRFAAELLRVDRMIEC